MENEEEAHTGVVEIEGIQQGDAIDAPVSEEKRRRLAGFAQAMESFIANNRVALSAVYLMTMVVCGTLLVLVYHPNVALASGGDGPTGDGSGPVNAVLWSLLSVVTFLFILAIVFMISRRRSRARGEVRPA